MAVIDKNLTATDLRAGADYLKALRKLHFEPDFMGWLYHVDPDGPEDGSTIEKQLAIVTSMVDYSGATALYDLLFKAYDAAVTPAEIDPFIVIVYSPKSAAGGALLKAARSGSLDEARQKALDAEGPVIFGLTPDSLSPIFVMVAIDGLLVAPKSARKVSPERNFRDFEKQVVRLAS